MKAWDSLAAAFGNRKLLIMVAAIVAVALALGAGPAAAVAPVVTVENATNVEYTTADVEGTVNPEGQFTGWRFQYATQADFSDAQEGPSGYTETSETVSGQLGALQPSTTYHLRLLAENGDGQSEAVAASTFTTKVVTKPTPSEPQVSSITAHTAKFEATVDPNAPEPNASLSQAAKDAYKTHWWFTCEPGCSFNGPSEGYLEADADPLNAADSVSAEAAGLAADTPYKVVLHAQNAAGEETDETPFSTSVSAPGVALNPDFSAYEVDWHSALIKGSVNPENSKVSDCHFVYGIGTASGNTIPCNPPHPAVNETQRITVNATSGQFKLSFESETTGNLAFNASAAEVQAALEGLAAVGAGNVEVSGGPGGPGGVKPYVVVFVEDLSGQNLPQIVAEDGTTPLAGDAGVRTIEQGGGGFDEKQRITIRATAGQFKLTFGSETTPDLSVPSGAAEVQAALEGLAAIGAGNVRVNDRTENVGGYLQGYYLVTFQGVLAGQDVPQLTATSGTEPLKGSVGVGTVRDGSLTSPADVSALLTGLSPETEYRYKLVATNGVGTEESDEQSFRTLAQPQPEGACGNEARRQEQHLFPAECRAFEMVSPTEKSNAPVAGEGTNVAVALDGNRAYFVSRGGFAGTTGSGIQGFSHYLSRRSATGWETQALTPTPAGAAFQTFGSPTDFALLDENLHGGSLWALDLPQRSDDISNALNIYRMDFDTKALETVTKSDGMEGPLAFADFSNAIGTWGASPDAGVISFRSETKLLPNPEIPDEVENGHGTPSTYEWDHGTLRLAGILPDGHVPAGGSTPPVCAECLLGKGYRATVSRDGSRLLFASPASGNQQLYMRINHSKTVWISEPEASGFSGEPEEVLLQWVSPDARKILFTTTSGLVNEDTDGEADLYLYSDGPNPTAEDNLQLITHGGESVYERRNMASVLGASDDASRIYYPTQSGQFMLWEGGAAHQIFLDPLPDRVGGGPANSPGIARVTSDGRIFAYFAEGQMYVYDAERNTLTCASCAAHGPTVGSVPAEPDVNGARPGYDLSQLRPRFLSADGSKVFFSTTSALVPEDTNGVLDVYVYNTVTGQRQLLSSGKGDQGEWFVNASPSGNDVFFITNQALIGRDVDVLADLYDARVEGGFPEPPPPPAPCSGDGCRGPLSSGQGASSPATASFSGPGNRHHKKGHKHRKRHHRKHHRHHHARHHHHKKGTGR
ncbi:MAG TPA: hypothetical protein VFN85_01400 [Solirubrobacterales bacterium]|nr:hypothetical protein [Solirubrobacterales bacterium]